METLTAVLFFTILTEALTQFTKPLRPAYILNIPTAPLTSIAIALIAAFTYQLDLTAILLYTMPTPVGILLTAVAMSRGSNALHALLRRLKPSPA